MLESLTSLFDSDSFIPHGHCYLWKPQLVWLHLASDLLIGLAYYSIPIMLFYFVYKRNDTPFQGIFLLFGTFIIACGTSHFMAVWTLWHPDYWLSGGIKLITAFVSLYTAVELLNLIPKALALPTPAQLEAANHQLKQEMGERTLAEAALKLSDTRFSLIFENAAIGIVLADTAGEILESNPAFQHMLGYSDQELQGMHFADFTHPQSLTVEEEIFQEMVTGDRDFYQLEKLYIRKDGNLRWGHLTVSLVRDAQNNPQYSIATIENITERKQAEVAVQLYREHLEELVQARTAELTQANEQLSWQATHDAPHRFSQPPRI
ncbi:MAG: PAS domain S-box protein [Potamolinea sp.]